MAPMPSQWLQRVPSPQEGRGGYLIAGAIHVLEVEARDPHVELLLLLARPDRLQRPLRHLRGGVGFKAHRL